MRPLALVAALALLAPLGTGTLAAPPSPYAGEQLRQIKALSDAEIDDLLNGRGMGLAKAGELNGYPGPIHVLDLAAELQLTPEQIQAVTGITERMSAAAKPLGSEIIERERMLDRQFASGQITGPELAATTRAIGDLQGRLRAVHLAAHIETKAVLTPDQAARYTELRGYGAAGSPAPHDHGKAHGG